MENLGLTSAAIEEKIILNSTNIQYSFLDDDDSKSEYFFKAEIKWFM